jgi:hypothetical protein
VIRLEGCVASGYLFAKKRLDRSSQVRVVVFGCRAGVLYKLAAGDLLAIQSRLGQFGNGLPQAMLGPESWAPRRSSNFSI